MYTVHVGCALTFRLLLLFPSLYSLLFRFYLSCMTLIQFHQTLRCYAHMVYMHVHVVYYVHVHTHVHVNVTTGYCNGY